MGVAAHWLSYSTRDDWAGRDAASILIVILSSMLRTEEEENLPEFVRHSSVCCTKSADIVTSPQYPAAFPVAPTVSQWDSAYARAQFECEKKSESGY